MSICKKCLEDYWEKNVVIYKMFDIDWLNLQEFPVCKAYDVHNDEHNYGKHMSDEDVT
jgi:hypothetical protein